MNVLLSILLLFIHCSSDKNNNKSLEETAFSKNQIKEHKILYKKANSSEPDEYTEGAYYLYDINKDSSTLLFDGVLMDYSEAWITANNQYVIFTISSVILLDENRNLIERFDFKETELVIGAQYDKRENKVYFLLKDTKQNMIDLCELKLENKELKKIIENTGIKYNNIEISSKKMFLATDNVLFIEDSCNSFSFVNLIDSRISKINLDQGDCFTSSLGRNKKGIIYLKYMDALKTSYELREYDFSTKNSQLLLDGKNQNSKPVSVKLFSDPERLSFLIQIDGKLFFYDYNNFNEIKINTLEILSYSENHLIYLDSLGKVKSMAL